jgi:Asp-tRNA(Asn)/Glu-tRNA(Gln) amidotransferase A subunit family amidase
MSAPLLTLGGLAASYRRDPAAVLAVAADIETRLAACGITAPAGALDAAAADLLARHPDPAALPLWGVPCVIGANIDSVGLTTSAGVPALDFLPDLDAPAVSRLRAAGALIVGKAAIGPLGFDDAASATAAAILSGVAAIGLASDRTGVSTLRAAAAGVSCLKLAPRHSNAEGLFAAAPGEDSLVIAATDLEALRIARSVLAGPLTATPDACSGQLGFLDSAEPLGRFHKLSIRLDTSPFVELAALMEDDVWLAARLADVELAFAEMPDRFPAHLRRRLSAAVSLPARDLVAATRCRDRLKGYIDAAIAGVDMLLLPADPRLAGFLNACDLAAVTLADGRAIAGPAGAIAHLLDAASTLSGISSSTGPIDIGASSPLAHC